MGSLIRASAMRGYPELVRELGGDPAVFMARFGIPATAERQQDTFISFASLTRMLEATAEELRCPDFGLRLSGRQGLEILGADVLDGRLTAGPCWAAWRRLAASSISTPPR